MENKAEVAAARRAAAHHRREQERIEADRHHKFDRNLRVIAGVVTVLGAAATTLMKVMEVEQNYRNKPKKVKGRVVRTKRLKAPPKQKRQKLAAYWKLTSEHSPELIKLQKQANAVLKLARRLKGGH
jgi:hypothetical protein